jgi:hypothetical protein
MPWSMSPTEGNLSPLARATIVCSRLVGITPSLAQTKRYGAGLIEACREKGAAGTKRQRETRDVRDLSAPAIQRARDDGGGTGVAPVEKPEVFGERKSAPWAATRQEDSPGTVCELAPAYAFVVDQVSWVQRDMPMHDSDGWSHRHARDHGNGDRY